MRIYRPQQHWILDAGLFAAFLALFCLDLTGIALHQWLGLAVFALAGYHLVAHWSWVKAVTARFRRCTSPQARLYYLLDAALLAGFTIIVVTGLVISTWLMLPLENYAAWLNVHIITSVLTLTLVVIKIGLHWRWVVVTAQRFRLASPPIAQKAAAVQPAAIGRGEFLRLMGIASAAAVLAASNALSRVVSIAESETLAKHNADLVEADTPANTPQANLPVETNTSRQADTSPAATPATTYPTAFPTGTPNNTATPVTEPPTACTVRCSRGCSFPGQCRRYVDANGNNRCDFGECL